MRRQLLTLSFAIIGVLSASVSCEARADIKCWTNKDGVRECGNVVPPEYSQQEQLEISNTGITTGRKARAKTPEELEQARREEAAKAEAERKAREQAAADRALLDTYSSEEDIVLARDGKVADIESRIRITESHVAKLNKNLHDIIQNAAAMEQRGEQPGEKVAQDIANVRNQIKEQEAFIASKRAEQREIRARYDADLVRYREMKARATAAATPAKSDSTGEGEKAP